MTCKDCEKYRSCPTIDKSRNTPCADFKKKEGE